MENEAYIPKRMSEGELLETVLGMLSPEGAFMLGEIMGIMRKGDQVQIAQLELEVKLLRASLNDARSKSGQLRKELRETKKTNERED